MLFKISFVLVGCLFLAHVASGAATKTKEAPFGPDLTVREFRVPVDDGSGLTLFVRNKYLKNSPPKPTTSGSKTVLFIAGATYPTSSAFDLQLDGLSWMDYLARSGFDVWLVDQRGYGLSDRPPQMSAPAADNGPDLCTTSVQAADVYSVIRHIQTDRKITKVHLIGWSWGTSIMALTSSLHPEVVETLTLYAPQWVRAPVAAPTTAYRTVDKAAALSRWYKPSLAGKVTQEQLIPNGWFDIWWDATVALDSVGAAASPPVVRAPNGITLDNSRFWGSGIPVYDVSKLTMPVLIVHGEWDEDLPVAMAQGLWNNLTAPVNKRWVEIAKGTHTIIMEWQRMELFRAVNEFLLAKHPVSLLPQSGLDRLATSPSSSNPPGAPPADSGAVAVLTVLVICVAIIAIGLLLAFLFTLRIVLASGGSQKKDGGNYQLA